MSLVLVAAFFLGAKARAKKGKTEERIYYMAFGSVYCNHVRITECGVNLSQCGDGRLYYCMQNVAWEDEGYGSKKKD
jgi:hypothetical protein